MENPVGANQADRPGENLPYSVDLADAADSKRIEKTLGRAATSVLARAIFKAAQAEYLHRRIILRQGDQIISDS